MVNRIFRRAMKAVAALALFAVLGIAALVGSMWLDHTRETLLPTPTGPFAIGRTTYVWSDSAQPELMATQPGTKREIFAWIWYPAAPPKLSQPPSAYLPAPWRIAVESQRGALINHILTRDLSLVRTHSNDDVDLAPQQLSYPVILMRAGLAGLVTGQTSLAEDLASHGYVVVGFDAPYRSSVVVFPDGRVIPRSPQNNADLLSGAPQEQLATKLVQAWGADTDFALDQLQRLNTSDSTKRFLGRLDMQRIGLFGYSLGGATTLQFCHDDARCKAGIDVDGAPLGSVIGDGVSQPFMFLMEDMSGTKDEEGREVERNIRSIYDKLPEDHRLQVSIRGANHFGFNDDVMLKSPMMMSVLHTLGFVHIDGRRQIAVTAHYISAFFDVYLKGAPPSSTLRNQPGFPEVEYIP